MPVCVRVRTLTHKCSRSGWDLNQLKQSTACWYTGFFCGHVGLICVYVQGSFVDALTHTYTHSHSQQGRAGFNLPAVDIDTITYYFPDALTLMHTLQVLFFLALFEDRGLFCGVFLTDIVGLICGQSGLFFEYVGFFGICTITCYCHGAVTLMCTLQFF